MKMRERPIRGKKYQLLTGEEVTALESVNDSLRVLLANDMLATYPKSAIDLPIIDTKDYEKLK